MWFRPVLILAMLSGLSACSFKFWEQKHSGPKREIASLPVKQLLIEEVAGFSEEIDEKLLSLHSYQLIIQKYLARFDEEIPEKSLEELYQSEAYLSLIASRTQVDEIEDEIIAIWNALGNTKKQGNLEKKHLLEAKLQDFAQRGPLFEASLHQLLVTLKLSESKNISYAQKERDLELDRLGALNEFQIYEKNIEHISHMWEVNIKGQAKKFYPSATTPGNVTGLEFPEKVWAITFDDGPHPKHSKDILKNLELHKLSGTFFMLGKSVKANPAVAKHIASKGHEVGSHSYSHRILTMVGELALHKEIDLATQEIEVITKKKIKYFRLPYGMGIKTPDIREKIAAKELIHVIYTIDSLDWILQDSDSIVRRTMALMKKTPRDSGILLFHDTHERSVKASKEIMEYLNKDARRTCTVGQIVSEINQGAVTVCPKS